MTKDILEKLLERTALVILFAGVILLVLGAAGGITVGAFSLKITEIIWRVSISVIGVSLVGLGSVSFWKDTLEGSDPITSKQTLHLSEWDADSFRKRLAIAKNICMISVSNYNLISDLSEEWRNFLKRGGQLRCIYVKPQGGALELAASRSTGVERDIEHLRKQYNMTIEAISDIAQSASQKNRVEVKAIDYLHGSVLTILDPGLSNGVAYVTLQGYGHHYTVRPSFILLKKEDEKWFNFFQEVFENMWFSEECELVEL
jgi:hypothetical protein